MEESKQRLADAHNLIYEFMEKENIPVEDYSFSLFTDHVIEKYGITFRKLNFGKYLGEVISGVTICNGTKWLIHINNCMINSRQNFTVCHELSHFIWDCDFGNRNSFFNSTKDNEYEEKDVVERLADNSAGVFMLPDICIKRSIEDDYTYNMFMRKYKISNAALRYRLIQFLVFHLNCPTYLALEAVDDYRYKGDLKALLFFFNKRIFPLSKRVEQDYKIGVTID